MDIASVVHVRHVQQALGCVPVDGVALVGCLQEDERNTACTCVMPGALADPSGQRLPVHGQAKPATELGHVVTWIQDASPIACEGPLEGSPNPLRDLRACTHAAEERNERIPCLEPLRSTELKDVWDAAKNLDSMLYTMMLVELFKPISNPVVDESVSTVASSITRISK